VIVTESTFHSLVSRVRGRDCVGSPCTLTLRRNDKVFNVKLFRRPAALVEDLSVMFDSLEELEACMRDPQTSSRALDVVRSLVAHITAVERKRGQAEADLAEMLGALQAGVQDMVSWLDSTVAVPQRGDATQQHQHHVNRANSDSARPVGAVAGDAAPKALDYRVKELEEQNKKLQVAVQELEQALSQQPGGLSAGSDKALEARVNELQDHNKKLEDVVKELEQALVRVRSERNDAQQKAKETNAAAEQLMQKLKESEQRLEQALQANVTAQQQQQQEQQSQPQLHENKPRMVPSEELARVQAVADELRVQLAALQASVPRGSLSPKDTARSASGEAHSRTPSTEPRTELKQFMPDRAHASPTHSPPMLPRFDAPESKPSPEVMHAGAEEVSQLRLQLRAVMDPLEAAGLAGSDSIRALCAAVEGPTKIPVQDVCGLLGSLRGPPEFSASEVAAFLKQLRDMEMRPAQVRVRGACFVSDCAWKRASVLLCECQCTHVCLHAYLRMRVNGYMVVSLQ
jgi:hypothetical protein